jgi:hypothetical protein
MPAVSGDRFLGLYDALVDDRCRARPRHAARLCRPDFWR